MRRGCCVGGLSSIAVEGLFGHLSYKIEALDEESVIYLIGKNGVGKTTILRLLHDFGTRKLEYVRKVNFRKIIFEFFEKKEKKVYVFSRNENHLQLTVKIGNQTKVYDISLPQDYVRLTESQKAEYIKNELVSVKKASCGRHWTVSGNGHFTDSQLIEKCENNLFIPLGDNIFPNWKTAMIETNRLSFDQDIQSNYERHKYLRPNQNEEISVVQMINTNLQAELRNHQNVANQPFLNLGGKFFKSAFEQGQSSEERSSSEINTLIKKINELSRAFAEYGFMKYEPQPKPPSDVSGVLSGLYYNYLVRYLSQLKKHEGFVAQFKIFENFVNSSMITKKLQVKISQGVILLGIDNAPLSLDDLSTGEQHILTMAYKLVFGVPKNSTVLIDEPEISMHLDWQLQFGNRISKVGELRELRFICATHSPSILSEQWNKARTIKQNVG